MAALEREVTRRFIVAGDDVVGASHILPFARIPAYGGVSQSASSASLKHMLLVRQGVTDAHE